MKISHSAKPLRSTFYPIHILGVLESAILPLNINSLLRLRVGYITRCAHSAEPRLYISVVAMEGGQLQLPFLFC